MSCEKDGKRYSRSSEEVEGGVLRKLRDLVIPWSRAEGGEIMGWCEYLIYRETNCLQF